MPNVRRTVIASNGVPFLQMRAVGSHSTSGREKEGIKERMGLAQTRPKKFAEGESKPALEAHRWNG